MAIFCFLLCFFISHIRSCTNPRTDISDKLADVIWEPISQSDLSWNFVKFLVDKNGLLLFCLPTCDSGSLHLSVTIHSHVVLIAGRARYRYPDKFEPSELYDDILALLNE